MESSKIGLNTKDHWELVGTRTWKTFKWILVHCIKYYHSEEPISTIVDLGCGNGEFLETCAHFGIPAIGIDAEKDALITCQSKGLSVKETNMSSDQLPFADNSISIVVCSQLIEHLEKKDGIHLMNEVYRILKNNGLVLIYSPSYYNRSGRTMPFHLHCWKPNDLKHELATIGFGGLRFLFAPMNWIHFLTYKPKQFVRVTNRKPNLFERFLNFLVTGFYILTKLSFLSANTSFVGYKIKK